MFKVLSGGGQKNNEDKDKHKIQKKIRDSRNKKKKLTSEEFEQVF